MSREVAVRPKANILLTTEMLKLPPPIWALIYVLTAAAISWFFWWSKVPGFPLAPLGISLVAISWILPVWAIVLFRSEGIEVEPTSPTNRKLITGGPYQFTRNPMYLGLVILTLGVHCYWHRSSGDRCAVALGNVGCRWIQFALNTHQDARLLRS
jgi:protein-S-isoprenylcysteine O-methyltransferase Ste14